MSGVARNETTWTRAERRAWRVPRRRRGRPTVVTWTATEREAWLAPARLRPSEWAERHRVIPEGQSDQPGPWRNELTPYLTGIMDLPMAEGVEQVNVAKSAQVGASEALRNVIGCWADGEPDPVGLTLPDRVKGRRIVTNRLIPLFEQTPQLARLIGLRKHAVQAEQIRLMNGFILHLAWAGSRSSTASDPWRRSVNDEVDIFEEWASREDADDDIVARTWKRTTTYGPRRVQINLSTPTDLNSRIQQLVDESRYCLDYLVPCPHCEGWQTLSWYHVRWAKPGDRGIGRPESGERETIIRQVAARRRELADWLMAAPGRVWIECHCCGGAITEADRAAMVRRGAWGTANAVDAKGRPRETDLTSRPPIVFDAERVERWPTGTRIGMRIWAAYSLLGTTLSTIAAEYLRALGQPRLMRDFTNQTLGEVYRHTTESTPERIFAEKARRATTAEGVVPNWCGRLVAGIDTQADRFYVVIRAFGSDLLSQRVWHGVVSDFADLDRLIEETTWPSEDVEQYGHWRVALAGIDSGGTVSEDLGTSRTMEVYRWAMRHRATVRALKGAARPRQGMYLWRGTGNLDTVDRPVLRRRRKKRPGREVPIWWFASHHFESFLSDLIRRGVPRGTEGRAVEEAETWLLNTRADEEYARQMANAECVPRRRRGRIEYVWQATHPGGRWDYRDAEKMALVTAHLAQADALPETEEIQRLRREIVSGAAAMGGAETRAVVEHAGRRRGPMRRRY